MAEESSPAKGKGKRPAEDMDVDASATSTTPQTPPSTTPQVIRRHWHRRRNVAATVWGPSLPGQASSKQPQRFNLYKAILRHPNLFFQFAIRLPITTIIDLYAIDKEFHYRFNKYSTSIVSDYTSYHAPHAAFIFSWIMFPELCISDPLLKPMDGRPHLARDIPSLRWAKMVLYRDNVVRGILTCLALEGLRVPRETHTTLIKYWLLMEIRTTAMRQAFLSDSKIWTDTDIIFFQLFLVKLDMLFQDPVLGSGMCELSHLLLTQKSLSLLYNILKGKTVLDYDDLTDMLIRTYLMDDLDTDTHTWLDDEVENGVPEESWGLMCREQWCTDGARMEPAVDMVTMEGIKRGLHVHKWLLDFMLYGFMDDETEENLPCPRKWRADKKVVVPSEGWPAESLRKQVIETLDDRFDVGSEPEGGSGDGVDRAVLGLDADVMDIEGY
ncbi:hypothetical protein BU26DRAFT_532702 [Trematosphaeria pertusa]|uniref:Uncharacterized protein n=1 Tax=Trematosphaeria pertusa TaxID=390896 RepID=A0A6A6I6N1_9PLEO|nr:uncharacterized protein BU26DRAFT_532702 [Trematosphaeria pertusa]KAF2246011.1 hypothetical protein BU26DRAFT_532702 [Trematosphaeria pertusa]